MFREQASLEAFRSLHTALGLEGLEVETSTTKFVAGSTRAKYALKSLRRLWEPEPADRVKAVAGALPPAAKRFQTFGNSSRLPSIGRPAAAHRINRLHPRPHVALRQRPTPTVVVEHVSALPRELFRRTWQVSWSRQLAAKHDWKLVNGPIQQAHVLLPSHLARLHLALC